MHYDPFEVQVITETKVSTLQKVITGVLTFYFFVGAGSVAFLMYLSNNR